MSEGRRESAVRPRDLGVAFGVSALGAVAALPALEGNGDPIAFLAWLALVAPAAGALAGGLGLGLWPAGLVVPGIWMGLATLVDASAERDLPTPLWGALVFTGFFAAGLGLGAGCARRSALIAAALLAFSSLLAGLPGAFGLVDGFWKPETAAFFLDLSPFSLAIESSGVDWMRHPAVYDPVGSASMGPDVRTAFRGSLAGPVALLVGCVLAIAGGRRGKQLSPSA